jgi:hypothetical protein
LEAVEMGQPEDGKAIGELFGIKPAWAGRRSLH